MRRERSDRSGGRSGVVTAHDSLPFRALSASAALDAIGWMWLYISRPAPDWRDHVERTAPNPDWLAGGYRYGPGASESVIEVVDIESGRVLVSQVLDVAPAPRTRFFAPGWLAVYDEEEIVPLYQMYRVRLVGSE